VPESGDDPTDLALRRYRQGDVLLELQSLAMLRMEDDGQSGVLARLFGRVLEARAARTPLRRARLLPGGSFRWLEEPTPNGVVLISQTCDIVQSHLQRPTVQVAKLIQLKGTMAQEAADGRRPRFAAVPNEGGSWFADLEVIGTIDKLALVRLSNRKGVLSENQLRSFAEAVGRRFSRFPFPDEVTEQTDALVKEVQSKYRKETSPLGQVLQQVLQLRLQAHPRWDDPNAVVTLFVICNLGVLPTFENPPDVPPNLAQWLQLDAAGVAGRTPSEIAERLLAASPGSVEAWHLWDQLGRVWARRCSEAKPTGGTGQAHEFHAEVLSADEFNLDRVRSSEVLDVDYLSPPTPTDTPSPSTPTKAPTNDDGAMR
jgi:hypothetical protein